MVTKDYEKFVLDMWGSGNVEYCAIGLGGEIGEVLNEIKKEIRNKEDRRELIVEELGDSLYYLTRLANFYDTSLAELMERNKVKLEKRQHAR